MNCYNCQFLDKSQKSKLIEEKGYLPYYKYGCKKNRMCIRIYISKKQVGVYNWKQESEETQLKQMGCSEWKLFQKEEDITLFDWGTI